MRVIALCIFSVALGTATSSPAQGSGDCDKAQVQFDHLKTNRDAWRRVKLRAGDILSVCVRRTYPPAFTYTMAGIELTQAPGGPEAAGGVTEAELSDRVITQVHDDRYGGYVLRISASNPDDRTAVTAQDTSGSAPLNDVRLFIDVETVRWRLSFSGAFVGAGLTNPKYAVQTVTDAGGVETKMVVEDRAKQDDVALGIGAFIHAHRGSWWALTFGLGIDSGSRTTYYAGPSLRLGDEAALTAGYAWGGVDALPAGQALNQPPISDNVLGNLATRNRGALFVGFSYSFLGGTAKGRLEKPFKGAGDSAARSSPSESETVPALSEGEAGGSHPAADCDGDGVVDEMDDDECPS